MSQLSSYVNLFPSLWSLALTQFPSAHAILHMPSCSLLLLFFHTFIFLSITATLQPSIAWSWAGPMWIGTVWMRYTSTVMPLLPKSHAPSHRNSDSPKVCKIHTFTIFIRIMQTAPWSDYMCFCTCVTSKLKVRMSGRKQIPASKWL